MSFMPESAAALFAFIFKLGISHAFGTPFPHCSKYCGKLGDMHEGDTWKRTSDGIPLKSAVSHFFNTAHPPFILNSEAHLSAHSISGGHWFATTTPKNKNSKPYMYGNNIVKLNTRTQKVLEKNNTILYLDCNWLSCDKKQNRNATFYPVQRYYSTSKKENELRTRPLKLTIARRSGRSGAREGNDPPLFRATQTE